MDETTLISLGKSLNLIGSIIGTVLIGVFLIVVDRNFWKHWVTKTSFIMYTLRWASYIVLYFVLQLPIADSSPWLILPMLDAGSICSILFAAVFMSSDPAQKRFWSACRPWLIIASIISLSSAGAYAFSDRIPVNYCLIYVLVTIGPSEIISNLATISMGWAFVVRYRSLTAYILLFLCLLYAFAQMPAFADFFIFRRLPQFNNAEGLLNNSKSLHSASWIFPFLAVMKLVILVLCLCLLYTPFLAKSQLNIWKSQNMYAVTWPPSHDYIEEAPKYPTGEAIHLPKPVLRILQTIISVIWAILGFLTGRFLFQ